jgi:DNA-binding NtrC family response regulator
VANIFAEALRLEGHLVDVFTDPAIAYEKISIDPKGYSLILLDVRMPGMSGIQLANRLLQVDDQANIVLISAFEDVDVGNFRFIRKPITIPLLIGIINENLLSK